MHQTQGQTRRRAVHRSQSALTSQAACGAPGFTLVEVLVALALMAVLALLSWRGLDSMLRTRDITGARIHTVALAQVSLLQWQADLNAVQALPLLMNDTALSWDGRVMRLLRRSGTPLVPEDRLNQTQTPNDAAQPAVASADAGMQVVAWTVRDGHWWRWQSPDLRLRGDVLKAWQQAAQWGQNPNDDLRRFEARLMPVQSWQVFYFRENAWVNPLSSAGNSAAPATANHGLLENKAGAANPLATPLPDAVQIQLTLDGKYAPDSGKLTLDWVNPAYNPSRS